MRITKLSTFCDKIIEAGLWATVITVPLFFNPHTKSNFDINKIAILRSIVLIMVLAWLIKTLEAGRPWRERVADLRASLPFTAPALIFVGAYLLSTVTSISPRLSFWGSYFRLEGFYTTLCYALIFLLALHTLRRPAQLHHLVTVLLLTSLPISLYAIMQHFGLDPVEWGGGPEVTFRASSTIGNAIFLGAYLIMVIPLTIFRIAECGLWNKGYDRNPPSATCIEPSRSIRHPPSAIGYILLLGAQLVALGLTQSRGPLLGLVGGMFFLALLWATVKGKRKPVLLLIAAVGVLLLLVLLSRPGASLAPSGERPYPGRLDSVLGLVPRLYYARTIQQRILMWQGVNDLIAAHPVRALSGYGPDTFTPIFYRHFPPDLAPYIAATGKANTIDRPHNEFLYVLTTLGFIGLVAYLVLLGSVFYFGLKWLGLIRTRQQRALFLSLWALGAFLGLSIPWLLGGSLQFAGIGITIGLLSGLAAFLLAHLFAPALDTGRRTDVGKLPGPLAQSAFRIPQSAFRNLTIALLSALVAHSLELGVGIAYPATRSYFWLYAAMVVALGSMPHDQLAPIQPEAAARPTGHTKKHPKRKPRQQPKPPNPKRRPEPVEASEIRNLKSEIPYALAITLIMTTLGFEFFNERVDLRAHNFTAIWFLAAAWLLPTLFMLAEAHQNGRLRPIKSDGFLYLWPCLLPLSVLLLFLTFYVPTIRPPSDASNTIWVYFLWLVIIIISLAIARSQEAVHPASTLWRFDAWVYLPLVLVALLLISTTNLNLVKGDVHLRHGLAFADIERWEEAILYFQQSSELSPNYDEPRKLLAQTYVQKWRSASDQDSAWLQEAQTALEQADRVHPLDSYSMALLASVHLESAEIADDAATREEHLQKASMYYQQAVARSPWPGDVYRAWGRTYHTLEKYDEAIEKYREALSFDDRSLLTYAYLADAYEAQGDFERAIEILEGAIARRPELLDPSAPPQLRDPNALDARVSLSYAYYKNGDLEKALEEGLKALELDSDNYIVHQNLGSFYEEMEQMDKAIAEMKKAVELAPPNSQDALSAKLSELIDNYLSQGQTYLDNEEWEKAEAFYLQVLSWEPDLPRAHSTLAYVYAEQGKLEQAVAQNQKVLEFAPDDYDSHKNLAILYQRMGYLGEALDEARIALKLSPSEDRPLLQNFIAELEAQKQR